MCSRTAGAGPCLVVIAHCNTKCYTGQLAATRRAVSTDTAVERA